jgi:biotin-(acetyl-CoA carboxylase) ligase
MIAALAIYKTLHDYAGEKEIKAKIKWINDVFVDGKKISGVLVTF